MRSIFGTYGPPCEGSMGTDSWESEGGAIGPPERVPRCYHKQRMKSTLCFDTMTCSNCKRVFCDEEILGNFGICNECFDALPCPCDDGNPVNCPLHGPEGRDEAT